MIKQISCLQQGHVPRNHLDYEQRGMARAKFDFQAKTNIELNFKRVRF